MITREAVVQQILAHLNGTLSERDLVRWAEDAFVSMSESDDEQPDETLLLDILGYMGAGDTPGFPLTWATLSDFLEQLGTRVKVVTT